MPLFTLQNLRLLLTTLILTGALGGSLLSCVRSGFTPDLCCPTADGRLHIDEWICPANCENGGRAVIEAEVLFKQLSNKELCNPDPDEFSIDVLNVTTNTWLNVPFGKQDTGTFVLRTEESIREDTLYEIHAKGYEQCGKVVVPFQVRVVEPGVSKEMLRWVDPCDKQGNQQAYVCVWSQEITTGDGVFVDRIENQNDFDLHVKKDNWNVTLGPEAGITLSARERVLVQGTWEVAIPLASYDRYADQKYPPIGIDVYLRCENCR